MCRRAFLMLSCFLICSACNPYGSKRFPVDNSVYLQQAQPSDVTQAPSNEPSIIDLQPEQETVFTDGISDDNAKNVPDLTSGKNVKIYKQPKARVANANKAKFIKIKPAKRNPKVSVKTTKNPHGTVVSEDITSKVTQQLPSTPESSQTPQNIPQQSSSQQSSLSQNTSQPTTAAQKEDTFVPLSDTPAKTYTDQEQKTVLANKQADQQAMSNRADQLQLPQQQNSEQMDMMPKAASALQPLRPAQSVPSGLDQSSPPKQAPTTQTETNASNDSKLNPSTQPALSSFEQMKILENQKKPMSAQQEAQLQAQLGKEINNALDQAVVELNKSSTQQKVEENLKKSLAANASSNKQPSNTSASASQSSVSPDSSTAGNTSPSLPAAPSATQPTPPPAKAAYDLKSKPIPQF